MQDMPKNLDLKAVVALGGSEDSLTPLKQFCAQIPEDSGIAFVVIMPFTPDHQSFMADLLALNAQVPFSQVQAPVRLEPNHAYLVPPDYTLSREGNQVCLKQLEQPQKARAPIDQFFKTLAHVFEGCAVGIVLRGKGVFKGKSPDGLSGLRMIKDKGGLSILQAPDEAEPSSIPPYNLELAIDKMLEPILKFLRTDPVLPVHQVEAPETSQPRILQHILAEIRLRTGLDFSRYTHAALLRRSKQRMHLHHIETLEDYLNFLRSHTPEVQSLADDFLIPDPEFFRDTETLGQYPKSSSKALHHSSEPAFVSYQALHQQLIKQLAPPSLLIDPQNNIAHVSEHAGRYLQPRGGEISSHIFKQLRKELQANLQIALYMARERVQAVQTKSVTISLDGQNRLVSLNVRPVLEPRQEGFLLIIFNEYELAEALQISDKPIAFNQTRLEANISLNPQRLETVLPQYHLPSNARSNDQELQRRNNALQLALEELTASKEDLQSLNEKLMDINRESHHKLEELKQANSDLQNLLGSSQIATLILDRSLRIVHFTPAVGKLFEIKDIDRGRSLTELSHRLGYPSLIDDAEQVLKTLLPLELEMNSDNGKWFLTQVMPYRSNDDSLGGIIFTFIDISKRKQLEDLLKVKQEELQKELAASHKIHSMTIKMLATQSLKDGLKELLASIIDLLNADSAKILLPDDETDSLSVFSHYRFQEKGGEIPEVLLEPHLSVSQRAYSSGQAILIENDLAEADPSSSKKRATSGKYQALHALPLKKETREIIGVLSIYYSKPHTFTETEFQVLELLEKLIVNVLERLKTEAALRTSEKQLRLLIDGPHEYAIIALDLQGLIRLWNLGAKELFGHSAEQVLNQSIDVIFSPEDLKNNLLEQEMETALLEGNAHTKRWLLRQDGSRFFASCILTSLVVDGKPQGFVNIIRDLTQDKARSEEREKLLQELDALNKDLEQVISSRNRDLVLSEQRFRQAFEAGPMAAYMSTLNNETILEVNAAFLNLTGYERSEVVGKTNQQLGLWSSHKDQEKLSDVDISQGFSDLELRIRGKDPKVLDVLASGEILKFDNEEYWLKMFVDITDRKRTEEELAKAIDKVMNNTNWFSQQIVQRLANTFIDQPQNETPALEELTPREREVLGHIAIGHNNEEIAQTLDIRLQTVRNYVTNIYSKLGVHSRAEAVIWARKRGIIAT